MQAFIHERGKVAQACTGQGDDYLVQANILLYFLAVLYLYCTVLYCTGTPVRVLLEWLPGARIVEPVSTACVADAT